MLLAVILAQATPPTTAAKSSNPILPSGNELVWGALSFFVSSYRALAEWRAVIARLDGFNLAAERAQAAATATDSVSAATTSCTRCAATSTSPIS